MSAPEEIATSATTARAALTEANSLLAPATTEAEELYQSASGRWPAVARAAQDAWEHLVDAGSAVNEALRATEDGEQLLSTITDEMSSDEVAGLLVATGDRFRTARISVTSAQEEVDAALDLAESADARVLLQPLDAAAAAVTRANSALYEALSAAAEEASSASNWGGGGAAAGGGKPGVTPVPRGFTRPAFPPDPNRLPRGTPKKVHPTRVDDKPLRRENESAIVLARAGYDIEQDPPPMPSGKRPDYRVHGEYWDCYAPGDATLSTIRRELSGKVRGGTPRVVLNLDDYPGHADQIKPILRDRGIHGLKEVLVVRRGTVTPFYPF
jgi:hypothetical protein